MPFVNIKLGTPSFVPIFNFLIIAILVFSCLVSTSVIERIHLLVLKIIEANTGQIDYILTPAVKGATLNATALQAKLDIPICPRNQFSMSLNSELNLARMGTRVFFLDI